MHWAQYRSLLISELQLFLGVVKTFFLVRPLFFKTTPPSAVVCELTDSSSHFTVHHWPAPLFSCTECISFTSNWLAQGMMGKIGRSAHSKFHICSCQQQCRGLDVSRRPHMAPDSLTTPLNQERGETPFHSPEVLTQALWVYTGGGPALQSRLWAQSIKYLQQFRYAAFGKYSSEWQLEKEHQQSINYY